MSIFDLINMGIMQQDEDEGGEVVNYCSLDTSVLFQIDWQDEALSMVATDFCPLDTSSLPTFTADPDP